MSTDTHPAQVVGTDTGAGGGAGPHVQLEEAWDLSPNVSIRPEPFGALVYHFGNRKLSFLKRPELLTIVESLREAPDVAGALAAAGIDESRWPMYAKALDTLAASDMICPRA